jgi:leucyl aminopeptidase
VKVDFTSSPQRHELIVRFFAKSERRKVPAKVGEKEFSGKENSLLHLHHRNLLCAGLGDEWSVHTMLHAAGSAAKFARGAGHKLLALDLRERPEFCEAAVIGAILGNYKFTEFTSAKSSGIGTLRCILQKKELPGAKQRMPRARKIADATNLARNLANQPGNVIYPETLAKRAREIAEKNGLHATVLDETALRAQDFGALVAVGSGSVHAPCLIVLEHNGGRKGERPLALVGKAVTFDSGGISIKPWAEMEAMIFDKCGGMAVICAMAAIAQLGIERNVVGIIPSAENLPSATAFRPGDIVKTYDGTQVEIVTTDAEGRLILADAISYARKVKNAAAIIDLATLTGACGIALGEHAAGLWSTSESLKQKLLDAAQESGERVWPMPLFSEYEEQNKSEVADIKNSGGKLAGACTGAAFLKKFARNTRWAHLDIAYTASTNKERPYLTRGATGFGVRLLVELVENWSTS